MRKVYSHRSSCHGWMARKDNPKTMEESVVIICCGLSYSPALYTTLCHLPSHARGLLCTAFFCAIPSVTL